MQYRSFEPGIEVNGHALRWTIDGFRILPSLAMRYLMRHGLVKEGEATFDVNAWYPLDGWLRAFEAIEREVGSNTIAEIGRQVGLKADLPPECNDLPTAFRYVDFGYHLFHRKRGQVMFDESSGIMTEGIGHYYYQPGPEGERKLFIIAENPYSCEFDRGLVTGVAMRVSPGSRVAHDDTAPCRKRGDNRSCTYAVTW